MNETGDEMDRHEKVLKGNYAIIGKVIGNVFFPDDHVSSADLKVMHYFFHINYMRIQFLVPVASYIFVILLLRFMSRLDIGVSQLLSRSISF